ncbi:hypothetical protein MRX96_009693 [Rhipicephalus microplus]
MLAAQRCDVYTPRSRGSNACDYKGADTKVDPGPFVEALSKAGSDVPSPRCEPHGGGRGARASFQQDCAPVGHNKGLPSLRAHYLYPWLEQIGFYNSSRCPPCYRSHYVFPQYSIGDQQTYRRVTRLL